MRNKLLGPGKPKGVSKSPWVCRIRKLDKDAQWSKWAKDAEREGNGTKEPTNNQMGQEKSKVAQV